MTTLGVPLRPDAAELARLVSSIVDSDRWTNSGALAVRLESELGHVLGWPRIRLTSSGTDALTVSLVALGLADGAEVVTTPLTFAATAHAIESAGLVPVFASVDPLTLTLDPDAVEQAISPRTAAILPVHLFGLAADPRLDGVGATHGLPVVYDAAHAFGFDEIVGRGAFTAYSLHATKILHTGEGGLVASSDPTLDQRVDQVRNFALGRAGVPAGRGINGKLPETSAAVGLAMLGALEAEFAARRRVREAYARIVDASGRVHAHAPGAARGLVMEVVRCDPRERPMIERELAELGVIARGFPALCAPGSRFADTTVVGSSRDDLVDLADSVLALPVHGRVGGSDLDAVAAVFSA